MNSRDLIRPAAACAVIYIVTPLLFLTGTLGALVLAHAGVDGIRTYRRRVA